MKGIKKKVAALRHQIGAISKNAENPFFHSRYFDINELIKQLQPHLDEFDLLLTQPIRDGQVITIISDTDGDESMESSLPLPDLQDPQKMGSAITYYRRYTLQSLLALQAEDDDGNNASGKGRSKGKSNGTANDDKEWLNESDKERWGKAEEYIAGGGDPKDLRKKYKVSKADMAYFEDVAKNGIPQFAN